LKDNTVETSLNGNKTWNNRKYEENVMIILKGTWGNIGEGFKSRKLQPENRTQESPLLDSWNVVLVKKTWVGDCGRPYMGLRFPKSKGAPWVVGVLVKTLTQIDIDVK